MIDIRFFGFTKLEEKIMIIQGLKIWFVLPKNLAILILSSALFIQIITSMYSKKQNQLATPERIMVLKGCGPPLYDYLSSHMEDKFYEDLLFSGIISGVSSALSVGLNCGKVKEIKLKETTILFHHDEIKDLVFIVIAKKITQNIRRSLLKFSKLFVSKFPGEIEKIIIPDRFLKASELINKCFRNIKQILPRREYSSSIFSEIEK